MAKNTWFNGDFPTNNYLINIGEPSLCRAKKGCARFFLTSYAYAKRFAKKVFENASYAYAKSFGKNI